VAGLMKASASHGHRGEDHQRTLASQTASQSPRMWGHTEGRARTLVSRKSAVHGRDSIP